jgi:hypothetical protein
MCGGAPGGQKKQARAAAEAQEQSLALQREQMAMQQEQMATQQAQYREQLAIGNAPPPPPPNEGAMVAMSAIESTNPATGETIRAGIGRRKLRTDLPQMTTLAIPGVA